MTTKPLPGKDPVETIKRNKPEAIKDERYRDHPVIQSDKIKKAFINDQVMDVIETDRYPRGKQSENYRVDVVAPLTGIPMVEIKPTGWVGPAPLRVPESRLDEIIELLSQVR